MITKTVSRKIPLERENKNDRFRVKYNDRKSFDRLIVIVTRNSSGDSQTFYFQSKNLPSTDSIHFSTKISNGEMIVDFDSVKPDLAHIPVIIQLQPEWFKMGYYVYIVSIYFRKRRYFYIGMTGDRKHNTARSPFYQMAGHFSKTLSSTENQIIKGLRDKIGLADIDKALLELSFTYYSYLIEEFNPGCPNHGSKRKRTEIIESALIDQMKGKFTNKYILNHRVSVKNHGEGKHMAFEILTDLISRINKPI